MGKWSEQKKRKGAFSSFSFQLFHRRLLLKRRGGGRKERKLLWLLLWQISVAKLVREEPRFPTEGENQNKICQFS